jgi:hypothetical protein
MRFLAHCGVVLSLIGLPAAQAEEPVFSGPQVGERLLPFEVRGVYDDDEGRVYDPIAGIGRKPVVLVFVHEATRPSIALTRILMTYAARLGEDGLVAGVVWLDDDATAAEQFLRRARHAMPTGVPIGISVDGEEGPGVYGLNRNVSLTVLAGEDGVVTANFALVQPSVQADGPRILARIAELLGREAPSLEGLLGQDQARAEMRPARPEETDPRLAELLRSVIRKAATAEQVDGASEEVERYVGDHEAARKQLGQIARRILDSGRLETYGTPRARTYLSKWAERYGSPGDRATGAVPRDVPDSPPDLPSGAIR